jgi:hypothetical protein
MAIRPSEIIDRNANVIIAHLEKHFDNAIITCSIEGIYFKGIGEYKITTPIFLHKSIVDRVVAEIKSMYQNAGWNYANCRYNEGLLTLFLQ